MHIKIITAYEGHIILIVTWGDMYFLGNQGIVLKGQQVSSWRLPEIAQPLPFDKKGWAIWLVHRVSNSLGIQSISVDDQTLRYSD